MVNPNFLFSCSLTLIIPFCVAIALPSPQSPSPSPSPSSSPDGPRLRRCVLDREWNPPTEYIAPDCEVAIEGLIRDRNLYGGGMGTFIFNPDKTSQAIFPATARRLLLPRRYEHGSCAVVLVSLLITPPTQLSIQFWGIVLTYPLFRRAYTHDTISLLSPDPMIHTKSNSPLREKKKRS